MKRLIALFIALSMLLTLVPSAMAADTAAPLVDDATVERIFGLGLIPHTTITDYQEEAPFTRGELAWLLDSLYNYKTNTNSTEFTWQFYGNGAIDNSELKEAPQPLESRFTDVPPSYWAYSIIESVVGAGMMNGVSATEFMPDGNVTVEQLVKCLVVLLGYDAKAQYFGGYPAGYMRVASELGLLNGIKSTGSAVNNGTLVRILDNCLDVRLMEFDGIVAEGGNEYIVNAGSEDTFLTGILGLGVIEGVMSDNSVTGLLGKSKTEENHFVVDGILLEAYSDIAGSLYGYIGREVECYFVADETSRKKDVIVYAALTGRDKATTILPEDFIGYSNGAVNYYENGKAESIALTDLFALIYNGKALTTYDESVFDVSEGSLTVVESTGNGVDAVIIEDYETWFVSAVDYDTLRIFNFMDIKGAMDTIDLDDYKYITIVNPDGTAGTIADITADSIIDVAANDDIIKILISAKTDVCVIDSITSIGGEYTLSAGDKEYTVSDTFFNYEDRLDFKIGDEVTLYLNTFGKIGWMVYGAQAAYNVGYIMDAATELKDMTGRVVFKMFDSVAKKEKIYYAPADKIRISNSVGKEITYKDMTTFFANHGAYRGIVRYLLNDNMELSYIEYPITDVRNQTDDKLALIEEVADTDSDSGEAGSGTKFRYNNFGGKAISNASTLVFCVDSANADSENGYDVRTVANTFTNEKYYNGYKIYTVHKGSKLADYIVYLTKSKSAAINYNTGINFAIVKSVANVYDAEENENVKAIKAFTSTVSTSTAAENNAILKLAADCKVYTPLSGEFKGELEPGDFIFYGMDEYGYVNEIRILWDQNGVNPDSPKGAPGTIVDSKGYYGIDGDDDFGTDLLYKGDITNLPNPLTLETKADKGHVARESKNFGSGPLAIQYGFIARHNYGALEITSQDITVEEYDETGLDGKHITRIWTVPTNVTVVKLSGRNNVEVVQGTSTALNPYRANDKYKQDCSRVIVFSNFAMMSKLIVINGYFEQ